jgi:hypothetical protein
MPHQVCLDFAWFDAEPPQFDLVVDAPQIFDGPIGPIACQIPCAVETRTRIGDPSKRIGYEPLCREVGASVVASC